MEILKQIKAAGVPTEVVIITGHSTVESAVEAMKQGAADYLSKPFSPDQLKMVLQKVVRTLRADPRKRRPAARTGTQSGLRGIIGESRPMERVFALIKRVAPTDGTVLVTGESGTGKEMVVRAIHRLSRRKDHPLLACDCSALAPTLLESELFGHVKGSFSGRDRHQAGPVRGRPQGHAVSRRSRQPQHGNPGKAAARAGDQTGQKGRRHRRARGRHPPDRRHQPRPGRNGRTTASSARTSTTG